MVSIVRRRMWAGTGRVSGWGSVGCSAEFVAIGTIVDWLVDYINI